MSHNVTWLSAPTGPQRHGPGHIRGRARNAAHLRQHARSGRSDRHRQRQRNSRQHQRHARGHRAATQPPLRRARPHQAVRQRRKGRRAALPVQARPRHSQRRPRLRQQRERDLARLHHQRGGSRPGDLDGAMGVPGRPPSRLSDHPRHADLDRTGKSRRRRQPRRLPHGQLLSTGRDDRLADTGQAPPRSRAFPICLGEWCTLRDTADRRLTRERLDERGEDSPVRPVHMRSRGGAAQNGDLVA